MRARVAKGAMSGPDAPCRIGDWRFDPTRNELSRGGESRRLPRREIALLARLVANAGQTVSREQLLAEVWSRRMVNDEVLSRAIAELRRALDDDARNPRYIETISKVGYRLLVMPEPDPEAFAPATESGPATGEPGFDASPRAARRHGRVVLLAVLVAVVAGLGYLGWKRSVVADPLSVENLLRTRPLTSDPGWEMTPRFTPDARSVLYARVERSEDEKTTLRLRSLDGSVDETLLDDGHWNLCPVASPDATRLVWLRLGDESCRVMERPLLGGAVRDLAACRKGLRSCPDFSPDGTSLVFTGASADDRHGPGLVRMDLATHAIVALSRDTPSDQLDFAARHSPDGSHVAFQRGDGFGGYYHVVPAAGGPSRSLDERRELNYGVTWSSDGRRLLVASDAMGYRALVVRDVETGAARLLGARGARFPDLAANGALVWEQAEYDANLWLVDLAGGAPAKQLTQARRYDAQPEFSPDGRRIAFLSNRDGNEQLYLIDLDAGTERLVPTLREQRWSQVSWSPDGTRLVATTYAAQSVRACVHVLESARTECPEALDGVESARFADDGAFLVLRESGGERILQRLDPATGAVHELARGVDRYLPLGDALILQRSGTEGLVFIAADGRERALAQSFGRITKGTWTATRDAAYIGLAGGASSLSPGIHRIPLDGGPSSLVGQDWPQALGNSISVSRDGRQAVLVKTDRLDLDLHWVPPP